MSEWRTIPGYPGYVISDDGVLVSPQGRLCKRLGDIENAYHVRDRTGKSTTKRIYLLLEIACENGEIVPNPLKNEESYIPVKKRRCHDCGKLTSDYRCAACLTKWRKKYHVSSDNGTSFDVLYYGCHVPR